MTYVPIIPPVSSQEPTDTDHRDLITALKLLSGEECMRDARQAQVLLVGLTESRHDDVVDDARAVLKMGLSQGWFEDTKPSYFILRDVAARSIATYEKGPTVRRQQLVMALIGGLVALGLGAYLYVQQSGAEAPPFLVIAIVAMLLVVGLGAIASFKAKNR